MNPSYSQAGQDIFVTAVLGTFPGTFLDIGSCFPIVKNNTFLLEQLGWKGLCVERDASYESEFNAMRKTPLIIADATRIEWLDVLHDSIGNHVDYISLDCDSDSTEVLRTLVLAPVQFKVITIEHDAYAHGDMYRDWQRAILEDQCYDRVCSNVKCDGLEFEDWWVNPRLVTRDRYDRFRSDGIDYRDILLNA